MHYSPAKLQLYHREAQRAEDRRQEDLIRCIRIGAWAPAEALKQHL